MARPARHAIAIMMAIAMPAFAAMLRLGLWDPGGLLDTIVPLVCVETLETLVLVVPRTSVVGLLAVLPASEATSQSLAYMIMAWGKV